MIIQKRKKTRRRYTANRIFTHHTSSKFKYKFFRSRKDNARFIPDQNFSDSASECPVCDHVTSSQSTTSESTPTEKRVQRFPRTPRPSDTSQASRKQRSKRPITIEKLRKLSNVRISQINYEKRFIKILASAISLVLLLWIRDMKNNLF